MTSLLLTRPREASQRFVDGLAPTIRNRLDIVISPLLEIVPLDEDVCFDGVGGLILTSANGVAAATRVGAPAEIPCYCIGPETTRAARDVGRDATFLGGNADELVSGLPELQPKLPLLHLSGRHRRGSIAARLTAAGWSTSEKAVYDQRLLPLTMQAVNLLNNDRPIVVPIFSPRTARQFADLHHGRAPLFIAALSRAVAEPLRSLNHRVLEVCEQPDAGTMRSLVEKLIEDARRVEGNEAAH